jgi:hypothetical protein
MYNSPMKNYSFSVFNHEDVKTKSWNLKEMGIAYYIVIDKISSHKTQYTFILTCSEDQWENYRTLMHLRRMRNDGTN